MAEKIPTGSAGLDEVLRGGIPANTISVIMGAPGTGKTILAEQLAKAQPEYREATEETFVQEIHDGIEFIGMLAFKVMDGEYDADHHPECEAVILRKDGEQTFFPASGFKNIG